MKRGARVKTAKDRETKGSRVSGKRGVKPAKKARARLIEPRVGKGKASARAKKAPKFVFSFGGGRADGSASMKELLGGKGANLHEMAGLGLPVPAGFTMSTEVCTHFYANGRRYPGGLRDAVSGALKRVEELAGRRFGDAANPLLVSVRSGARASMPGMMD